VTDGIDGTPGLNQLNALDPTVNFKDVRPTYKGLRDDALRVLAGLPQTQRAFTQLTIQPLDPDEPDPGDPAQLRWRNRRSRDDPDEFVVDDPRNPLSSSDLRIYIDKLDGRTASRYFYRTGYVDGAHNRSGNLSLSTPPVYLRRITAPRAPVITKVLAVADHDRQIVVRWASNREADLHEYHIYRSQTKEATRDIRLMERVHVEPVPVGDPMARPAEVAWTDDTVLGRLTFYYCVVAAARDELNRPIVSLPSSPVAGRALDTRFPPPPVWNPPRAGAAPNELTLSWRSPIPNLRCLVQRHPFGSALWEEITPWLARGNYSYTDSARIPGVTYVYRIKVMDSAGLTNCDFLEQTN
jgi:hypothetical protein